MFDRALNAPLQYLSMAASFKEANSLKFHKKVIAVDLFKYELIYQNISRILDF